LSFTARKQLRSLSNDDDDYGGRILTHMLLTQFKELNLRIRKGKRRLPGELGVSNSMECDIFPSVL